MSRGTFSSKDSFVGQYRNPGVCLTFDDGPDASYTPKILDILGAFSVKACFFVVGKRVQENPEIVMRIHNEGHDIGNHTFTHPVTPALDHRKIEKEIRVTDKAVRRVIGRNPRLFRPTWCTWNIHASRMLRAALDLGHFPIRWSVSSLDWLGHKSIIRGALCRRGIKDGDIFLFHDGSEKALVKKREATVSLLPAVLRTSLEKGFIFRKLSDHLKDRGVRF